MNEQAAFLGLVAEAGVDAVDAVAHGGVDLVVK